MKQVTLFTDGSCLGNPGPGGWACLLRWGFVEEQICGTEPHTTNNRMELHAVIAGLSALKESCAVRVVTDSQYVQHAMTRHLPQWIARGIVAEFPRHPHFQSGFVEGARSRKQPALRYLELGSGTWRQR